MSASASLIPELEAIIQHGTQEKRAATLQRIANLFVDGAQHFKRRSQACSTTCSAVW
jgi:hypothetical protein